MLMKMANCLSNKFVLLVLLFLNIAAYHNALHNELRYDQTVVYQGAQIPKFIDRLKFAFLQDIEDKQGILQELYWFRPIPFMISWELFKAVDGQPYKINCLNILLITITGFLLFNLISCLSGKPFVAFMASILFCIHPVNGMWVNYAPGGVHGYIALSLMLLSFLLYIKSIKDGRTFHLYYLSLAVFALGLLSHEIVLFLPIYMALAVYCLIIERRRESYFLLIPYCVLGGLFLWIRSGVLGTKNILSHGIRMFSLDGDVYGATLVKVFLIFIGKLISLQGIVISWCEPFLRDDRVLLLLTGCLLFGLLIGLLIFRRQSILSWSIALMFVGFIPVCVGGLLYLSQGLIYEAHWAYFTSIGYFTALGLMIEFVYRRQRQFGVVISVLLIGFWLVMGWNYNSLYADEIKYTLFYKENAPGFGGANIFLYEAYFKKRQYSEAKQAILESRVGNPNDFDAYYKAGLCDALRGEYSEAQGNLFMSLKMYSGDPRAHFLLGLIYEHQQKYEKANKAYNNARQAEASQTQARRLANAYHLVSKYEEARIKEAFPHFSSRQTQGQKSF